MSSPELPPRTPTPVHPTPRQAPPKFDESTYVVKPSPPPRVPGRWRWLAPLVLMSAGIVGVAVFGTLSLLKARNTIAEAQDKVAAVSKDKRADTRELAEERDDAVAAAAEMKSRAMDLARQLGAMKRAEKAEAEAKAKADEQAAQLEKRLRAMTRKEGDVARRGQRFTIGLADKVLFDKGKAGLSRRGKRYLHRLGAELKKAKGREVRVRANIGDFAVIKGGKKNRPPSDWELSAARALTVVHALAKEGVEGKRLAAVGSLSDRPRKRRPRLEIELAPVAED